MSSVTLLRRLGNHSRKNRLYRAFRELGRAIRTITLLRYLSEPQLREQITQVTNRNEAFHGFADWLMFGGKLIGHNDPDYQEKVVKFNELLANCVMYSTACDITDAANDIAAEGERGRPRRPGHDLARTSPTPSAGSGTGPSTSPRPTARPPPGWTWNPGCCSRRPWPKLSPTADADSPPHQPKSETCPGLRGPFLPYSGRTSTAFTTRWRPGDRLLLYTDGLVESRNQHGDFLPQDQIATALLAADCDQALDTLMTAVDRHTGGHSHDDIALLLLEYGTHRTGYSGSSW